MPETARVSPSPLWARAGTEPTPVLAREMVVTAAIAIADREGLSGVSMRRVAAELSTRPMSLYRHVASKDDLLDLMFDELAGEACLGPALPRRWQSALRAIAHRVRQVGLAHPWSVEVLGLRTQLGPNTIRLLDEWVFAVRSLRLPPDQAWRIVTAVNDYVTGYVVREAAQRHAVPRDRHEAARWQRDVAAYLRDLAASGDYPRIAPLLAKGYAGTEDNFEAGLTWLLGSIARQYG